MGEQILITGGAGFIGSHLADELLREGYRVRALDNLSPQVHGPTQQRPDYLDSEVELIVGDVRNPDDVKKALKGVTRVFHLAAAVGVGQSMYEVSHYTEVNNLGTAVVLQALLEKPVEKLVVASSMSIYGEGLYLKSGGKGERVKGKEGGRQMNDEVIEGHERPLDQLKRGDWELKDTDGNPLTPIPTPEWKSPSLASIYALSKFDQEKMCLMVGRAYQIPTVALRFFNVFGTRQALSNPYTGVLAIFASRYLNKKPALIFEDGEQKRDFVSVSDVARACRLAMEREHANDVSLNIGSGRSYSVVEVAELMADALNTCKIQPEVTGKYRVGDIRHCFADISRAKDVLGYEPQVVLQEGIKDLAAWLENQTASDRVEEASHQLMSRGLAI